MTYNIEDNLETVAVAELYGLKDIAELLGDPIPEANADAIKKFYPVLRRLYLEGYIKFYWIMNDDGYKSTCDIKKYKVNLDAEGLPINDARLVIFKQEEILNALDKLRAYYYGESDLNLDKREKNSYLILISYLLEKLKINIDDSSAKNKIITNMETTHLKIVNKTLDKIFKEVKDMRKKGNKSISEKNKK